LNIGAWARLRERVLDVFDGLHITEPAIDLLLLTGEEQTFVTVATAPGYWQKLTKGQRYNARQKYAEIVSRHTDSPLKESLRLSIAEKLTVLQSLPPPLVGSAVPSSGLDPWRGPFHSLTEP